MSQARAGILLLLAFVGAQAFRDVHLGHLFGQLGLFEVALLAFGSAALLFGALLLLFDRAQLRLLAIHWRLVLAVNVTTMAAWTSYFGALRLVEPAAANLAFSGVAPMAVAWLGAAGLASGARQARSAGERWLHRGLLATVILLAIIVSSGLSGFARLESHAGFAGVALAAFAGIAITAETIFAKQMNQQGISALAIVGVRFLLVTGLAAAMVAAMPTPYAGMSEADVSQQAFVFLLILIGPIYLAQAGLALTTPLLSGVILSVGPVATLALQSLVADIDLSLAMFGVTVLYSAVAIAAALLAARSPGENGGPNRSAPN